MDTPLLVTRCHWFIAQVFVSLLPILESEVGGGDKL